MAAMDTTADSATATLEDAELQAADAGEPVALGAAAATLMLAYISADQLEDARHLWRRTPEAARAASGVVGVKYERPRKKAKKAKTKARAEFGLGGGSGGW